MKLTSLLSLLTKKRSAKANDRALSRRRRFIIEALEERRVLAGGPFVQSISEAEYLVNTASVATVTFSEPVTGVDPSDFRLTTSKHLDFPSTVNVGAIQVTQVSTSIYQVVVNVINGDGELSLDLIDDGSIHNFAGQPLNTSGTGNFKGPTYLIDNSPPQLQTLPPNQTFDASSPLGIHIIGGATASDSISQEPIVTYSPAIPGEDSYSWWRHSME